MAMLNRDCSMHEKIPHKDTSMQNIVAGLCTVSAQSRRSAQSVTRRNPNVVVSYTSGERPPFIEP